MLKDRKTILKQRRSNAVLGIVNATHKKNFHEILSGITVELVEIRPGVSKGVSCVDVFVRAWKETKRVGFGTDGSVEIERIRLFVTKEYDDPIRLIQKEVLDIVKRFGQDDQKVVRGKIGNTISVFYPDPSPEATSVDGIVGYESSSDSWSTIRSAATGNYTNDSTGNITIAVQDSGAIDDTIARAFILFDTSSLPDADTIYDARLLFVRSAASTGSSSLGVVQSSPASDTAITTADYDQCGALDGATEGATRVAISTWADTSNYYGFTLNSTGLGWINKTGITKLGLRWAEDLDNTSGASTKRISFYSADTSGVATDPKLVVLHGNNTYGYSLDLESGSSQYASIADGSQTGLDMTGDFTLCAWVKPESSFNGGLIAKFNTGNAGYRLRTNGSFQVLMQFWDSSGNDTQVNSNDALAVGIWQHIAVTVDVSAGASGIKIYVNGVLKAQTTVTSNATSIAANGDAFTIGVSAVGGAYLDGKICNASVWSTIRTQQEIIDEATDWLVGNETNLQGAWPLASDYVDLTSNNNDLTATNSPVFVLDNPLPLGEVGLGIVSYWNFDASGGNAQDILGLNPLTNNNTATYTTGKINNAIDLEASSSQYFSVTDADQIGLDILKDIGISAWIKLESLPGSGVTYTIVSKWQGLQAVGQSYILAYGNSSGTYRIEGNVNDGTDMRYLYYNTTLSTGVWYHIVWTWKASDSSMKLYIDGADTGASAAGIAVSSILNGNSPLRVGSSNTAAGTSASNFFDGIIDEVGIWNRTLSGTEVSELYNGGNGVTYPFASGSFQTELTETVEFEDTIIRTVQRVLNEVPEFADTILSGRLYSTILNEISIFTDTIIRTVERTLTETSEFADTVIRTSGRVFTETAVFGDTIIRSIGRVLTETSSFVDKKVGFVLNGNPIRNIWSLVTRNTNTWTQRVRNTNTWTLRDKN